VTVKFRSLLTVMLAIVFTMRSLVTVGFMLAPSSAAADGALTVVICTSSGPATLVLDKDGQPVPQKPTSGSEQSCPYQASAPIAVLAVPEQVYLPAGEVERAPRPECVQSLRARHELPAPARGPPLIA
jgi:hypothetical protein